MEQLRAVAPQFLRRNPTFVMLAGVECSGKSTFFDRELARERYTRVSTDEMFLQVIQDRVLVARIRMASHSPQEMDQQLQAHTLVESAQRMERLMLEGQQVALDGINNSPDIRQGLLQFLRGATRGSTVCFWFNTPIEVCIERFKRRGIGAVGGPRVLSEDIIRRHAQKFTPPTVNEGFAEVIEIKTP